MLWKPLKKAICCFLKTKERLGATCPHSWSILRMLKVTNNQQFFDFFHFFLFLSDWKVGTLKVTFKSYFIFLESTIYVEVSLKSRSRQKISQDWTLLAIKKVSIFAVFVVPIFPYSVQMPENTGQKNSKYGHFS